MSFSHARSVGELRSRLPRHDVHEESRLASFLPGYTMTYSSAVAYLYRLQKHGIKLGLTTMTALMVRLGMPQSRYRALHIARHEWKGFHRSHGRRDITSGRISSGALYLASSCGVSRANTGKRRDDR